MMRRILEGRAEAEHKPSNFDDQTYEWLSHAIEEMDRRRAAALQGSCDAVQEYERLSLGKSTYRL